jgi:hypothetical protein
VDGEERNTRYGANYFKMDLDVDCQISLNPVLKKIRNSKHEIRNRKLGILNGM